MDAAERVASQAALVFAQTAPVASTSHPTFSSSFAFGDNGRNGGGGGGGSRDGLPHLSSSSSSAFHLDKDNNNSNENFDSIGTASSSMLAPSSSSPSSSDFLQADDYNRTINLQLQLQQQQQQQQQLDSIVNVTREYPFDYAIVMFGYLLPFVLVVTIITNLLVVAVLYQRHMRTPTNIVLFTMAIVDLCTLLSPSPWYLYIYTFGNHNKFLYPPTLCYAHHMMTDVIPVFFHTSSIWLALLLASQRYIYVCHPTLARTWCTVPRVNRAIFWILAIAFAHQIPRFFDNTFESVTIEFNNVQHLACRNSIAKWVDAIQASIYYTTYFVFRIFFVFIIPCFALLTLNLLLFRALKRAENKRCQLLKSKFKMVDTTQEPAPPSERHLLATSAYLSGGGGGGGGNGLNATSDLVGETIIEGQAVGMDPFSSGNGQSSPSGDDATGIGAGRVSPLNASDLKLHRANSCNDLRTTGTKPQQQQQQQQQQKNHQVSCKGGGDDDDGTTCKGAKVWGARRHRQVDRSNREHCCPASETTRIMSMEREDGSWLSSASKSDQSSRSSGSGSGSSGGSSSSSVTSRSSTASGSKMDDDEHESMCLECAACRRDNEKFDLDGGGSGRDHKRCSLALEREAAASPPGGASVCVHGRHATMATAAQQNELASQSSSILGGTATNTNTNELDDMSSLCPVVENVSSTMFAPREDKTEASNMDEELSTIKTRLTCGCPVEPTKRLANAQANNSLSQLGSDSSDACIKCSARIVRARVSGRQALAGPHSSDNLVAAAAVSRSERCGRQVDAQQVGARTRESSRSLLSLDESKQESGQEARTPSKAFSARQRRAASQCPATLATSRTSAGQPSATGTTSTTLYSTNTNSIGSLLQVQAQQQQQQQAGANQAAAPANNLNAQQQLQRNKSPSYASCTTGRGSRATLFGSTAVPLIVSGGQQVGNIQATISSSSRTMDSNRTTLMLVVVVSVFLIVEVPVALVTIAHVVLNLFDVFRDVELSSWLDYIKLFTNFFIMISYSVNFTIYCSMSKKFRETFRDLFFCGRTSESKRVKRMLYQSQAAQSQYEPYTQVHQFAPPASSMAMNNNATSNNYQQARSKGRNSSIAAIPNSAYSAINNTSSNPVNNLMRVPSARATARSNGRTCEFLIAKPAADEQQQQQQQQQKQRRAADNEQYNKQQQPLPFHQNAQGIKCDL